MALCGVLCFKGEESGGGERSTATSAFPPLGGQVGAGGLLLGIGGWAAELVQHGLIPEGRAKERRSSVALTGWAPLTPTHSPSAPPTLRTLHPVSTLLQGGASGFFRSCIRPSSHLQACSLPPDLPSTTSSSF